MPKQGNKSIAKKIAYFIADLEYNEVSTPEALAGLLEEFLDNILPENSQTSPNIVRKLS